MYAVWSAIASDWVEMVPEYRYPEDVPAAEVVEAVMDADRLRSFAPEQGIPPEVVTAAYAMTTEQLVALWKRRFGGE
jgi:hypothetical protein